MKCEEGNKLDLVEYLFSLGFTPTKIRGINYWYISPLRDEKEASFKIDRNKNVWYDHGAGRGGTVVDFVMQYFNCDVPAALQKLSSNRQTLQKQFISKATPSSIVLPDVHQQDLFDTKKSNQQRPPFHLHENSLINYKDSAETAIEIIAAKQPITDMVLCRYLKQRRIDKNVADKYCNQVVFKFIHRDAKYVAIGFKNTAGGYELRSENFKISSSPKYITYITNDEQNCDKKTGIVSADFITSDALKSEFKNEDKNISNQPYITLQNDALKTTLKSKIEDQNQPAIQAKSVAVFEGFFDFLTYQTIYQNLQQPLTDFLVLNSLAFFERTLLFMEKHEQVYLYFDHDEAGKKCLDIALKRSPKYHDERSLYEGYKDLNDWVMHFGKLEHKNSLKVSNKNRLP